MIAFYAALLGALVGSGAALAGDFDGNGPRTRDWPRMMQQDRHHEHDDYDNDHHDRGRYHHRHNCVRGPGGVRLCGE